MLRIQPFLQGKRLAWTLVVAVVAVLIYGCQESSKPASTQPAAMVPAGKGGAQLWSDNCMRCHNLRPPTQFSNNEWQIIVHHMRVRANLTGEEQRKILEFIQSANMR